MSDTLKELTGILALFDLDIYSEPQWNSESQSIEMNYVVRLWLDGESVGREVESTNLYTALERTRETAEIMAAEWNG